MAGSPVAVLFTTDGVEIPLKDSTSIPANARGAMLVGKDGSTSRFVLVDSTGRLKIWGDQLPAALGQTTASGSVSVVLASDQGSLTVQQSTAANLKAQVQGAGTAGTPSGGVLTVQGDSGGTALPVSGTVTANIGTTNGLALDATLTGGTQKAIARTAAKGITSAADLTSTASGANHQALDIIIYDASGNVLGVSGAPVRVDPTGTTTQPVSAASLPLPTGAATEAKQPALGTAGSASADVITIQGIASMTAVKVDGSAVTQPVSGSVTSSQGTAAALSGAWPVKVTDGINTMPTGDTVGRALFQKVTDGTNTAAVKAASTAAVASDPALVVAISPNNSLSVSNPSVGSTGSTLPASATLIGVSDGTNLVAPVIKAASTAAVAGDPSLVVALSPNTPAKIWDGTNTAAVKAASTASATTDPSLVVALSPNSPIKGTIQPKYGTANQTITITLASLASSATAARQSTVIDNTTNLYEDVLFFIKYTTVASTSTTGYLNVYGYATADGTSYSGGAGATDAALTIRNPTELVLLVSLPANTASATYNAGPFSFCRLYGLDRLPQKFGFVVANVSGQALNATAANHAMFYQGVNGNFV